MLAGAKSGALTSRQSGSNLLSAANLFAIRKHPSTEALPSSLCKEFGCDYPYRAKDAEMLGETHCDKADVDVD